MVCLSILMSVTHLQFTLLAFAQVDSVLILPISNSIASVDTQLGASLAEVIDSVRGTDLDGIFLCASSILAEDGWDN